MNARPAQPSIAVSATFTSEPVGLPLSSWLRELNLPHRLEFAPYGHVLQSLIDPNSILARNSGGLNVLLIRLEDWAHVPERLPDRGVELVEAVGSFATRSKSPLLLIFCPDASDGDSSDGGESITSRSNEVQQQIIRDLAGISGVYPVSSSELMETYPVARYFDGVANRTAHIPFSRAFFAGLGTMIARRLFELQSKPSKVVVLDCDNTLWEGVCGELGARGVRINQAQQALQRQMIRLRDQGMLLALCSKNNEQDVWDVFEQNDGMLLRREHIAASEINWNAKSENLRKLALKLGLGIDSLVLLDDNPIEVAEVQANLPASVAIRLPVPEAIPHFLQHVWSFDRLQVTDDDKRRAESYRTESRRQERRKDFDSLRQFLADLELQVSFVEICEENMDRVSQLTQRTNQFNVSLRRRTSAEIRHEIDRPGTQAIAVEVSDKFGEYGLVGLMLCESRERSLHVDTFLLSCRALGRAVEHHMLKHLGRLASDLHLEQVTLHFVQGQRNEPAAEFLRTMGESLGSPADERDDYHFKASELLQIDPLAISQLTNAADQHQSQVPAMEADNGDGNSELLSRIANDYQTVDQVLDRLSKEAKPRPEFEEPFVAPTSPLERKLAKICCAVLHVQQVGTNDSIHDLGGTSIQIVQIHSQLVQELGSDITITELYTLPSIRAIVQRIEAEDSVQAQSVGVVRTARKDEAGQGIAVIGMSGRFPGAENVEQFWSNLVNGVNSIVEIPEGELNLAADSPLRSHPNLVRQSASVKNADKFDARFFGIFPKEASHGSTASPDA